MWSRPGVGYTGTRVFDSGNPFFPWLSTRKVNRSPELLVQFRASLVDPGRAPVVTQRRDQPTDIDVPVRLTGDPHRTPGWCTGGKLSAHM